MSDPSRKKDTLPATPASLGVSGASARSADVMDLLDRANIALLHGNRAAARRLLCRCLELVPAHADARRLLVKLDSGEP